MAQNTAMFLNGHQANMLREFVVDKTEDISSIDTSQLLPGSRTFVINTSKWFMLNHSGQWESVNWNQGGGGSEEGNIYYDGGNEDDPSTPTDPIHYDGGEP